MKTALSLIFSLMMVWPPAMAASKVQAGASRESGACHHCACGGDSCCVRGQPADSEPAPLLPARASFSHESQIGLPAISPIAPLPDTGTLPTVPSSRREPPIAGAPLFQRFCAYLI